MYSFNCKCNITELNFFFVILPSYCFREDIITLPLSLTYDDRYMISWFSLCISYIVGIIFASLAACYNDNSPPGGRLLACICLALLWINYWYGNLLLTELSFVLVLLPEWNKVTLRPDIQFEKRLVMSFFVFILLYMIFF